MALRWIEYPGGCSRGAVSERDWSSGINTPWPSVIETARASYSRAIPAAGCSAVFITGARSTACKDFTPNEIEKITAAYTSLRRGVIERWVARIEQIQRCNLSRPDRRIIYYCQAL